MAYVDWLLKGPKIGCCNCDYGCPCEFNGRPTRAVCEGTGLPHHAIIRLPEGFEFREAEIASDTFSGEGAELGFRNRNCYAALTYVADGPHGIVT